MTNIKKALIDARARLIVLREFAARVREIGTVSLKAQELWEDEDQAAVDQLDAAIALANGETPLFEEEVAHA